MNAGRRFSRSLLGLAGAAACLVMLVLLWELRPSPPALPVGVVFAGELLRFLLWLTVTLLVLVVLARVVQLGRRAPAVGDIRVASRAAAPRAALLDLEAAVSPFASSCLDAGRYEPSWRRPRLMLVADEPVRGSVAAKPEPAVEADAVSAADEERVRVRLLGPLEVSSAPRRRRAPGPAYELIAFLALHGKGAGRDELLEALWPDQDPARSQQRFWQASKEARKLVGDAIVREAGRYRLDRARVEIDVDRLERLLAGAGGAPEPVEARLLEEALGLFRGAPLEGCDFRWADGARRRLEGLRVELLERVARARLGNDDARGALDAAEQGIAVDELHERFWQLALEAEAALGARDAVGRRYDELASRLDERLGLRPSGETRSLYLRLLGPAG